MLFFDKLKHSLVRLSTPRKIGLVILFLLILTFGLFHSCSQDETVARKQFYTIGRDTTWYPFHLRGKERNLIGFTDDLMTAIAKEASLNWVFIESSPVIILDGLDYERYDAIISTMQPDIVSLGDYVFSDLFLKLGLVLVVPQNSSATSLKDMKNSTIGISSSSYQIFKNIKEGGPHNYNIQLVSFENINQALNSLENGHINGIITHAISAYALTKTFDRGNLKVATAPLTDEGLRLVALRNKSNEALIKEVNDAFKKLVDNGAYAQLIKKWDLIDPSVQFKKN